MYQSIRGLFIIKFNHKFGQMCRKLNSKNFILPKNTFICPIPKKKHNKS